MQLSGRRVVVIDQPDTGVVLVDALVRAGAAACGPFADVWAALDHMRTNIIDAAVLGHCGRAGDSAVIAAALAEGGKPVLFYGGEPPADRVVANSTLIGACPLEATAEEVVAQLRHLLGPSSGPAAARRRAGGGFLTALTTALRARPAPQRALSL
ncbi:MAG TPA: hypothetical protein VG248_09815 [Caulobacteraceae bacterium]|jgi:hypothetical protein|nr:hypothetical protein [Caulobacteraceae bacterium]